MYIDNENFEKWMEKAIQKTRGDRARPTIAYQYR